MLTPFHLAYNVRDLDETRAFYGDVLGCTEGRSTETWVDYSFFGHQISMHLGEPFATEATGKVGEHMVPMPHLGVVLQMDDWKALAERLTLDLTRPIRTLSTGNRQKVGLVQAFMHQPELVILDEPTSGLDPLVRQEFSRIVDETKADGRTVFLSSHVLAEVERMADRVGIVREGRLVVEDSVESLKKKAVRRLEIQFGEPVPLEPFQGLPGVREVIAEDSVIQCVVAGSVDALIKVAAQFEVVNITSHEADLEAIFLDYYKEGEDNAE